jgi:hypothetical protein
MGEGQLMELEIYLKTNPCNHIKYLLLDLINEKICTVASKFASGLLAVGAP